MECRQKFGRKPALHFHWNSTWKRLEFQWNSSGIPAIILADSIWNPPRIHLSSRLVCTVIPAVFCRDFRCIFTRVFLQMTGLLPNMTITGKLVKSSKSMKMMKIHDQRQGKDNRKLFQVAWATTCLVDEKKKHPLLLNFPSPSEKMVVPTD